jgi:predicted Fe-Mo cluster-binding NifX family protein
MRIAVATQTRRHNSGIDPRLALCRFFIVCDTDTGERRAVPNASTLGGERAGLHSAHLLIGHAVDAVIAGRYTPHALEVLRRNHIKAYVGTRGTVDDAVADLMNDRLTQARWGPDVSMGQEPPELDAPAGGGPEQGLGSQGLT